MDQPKRIYLIRHAQSVYNIHQQTLKSKLALEASEKPHQFEDSPQYLQMKFNLDHEDCDITELGKEQCEKCREEMKKVKVDLVIVSPMRRALATCARVFKDHKDQPLVVVDPLFREIFESSCDIGSKLRLSMKEYPDFDYGLISNPDTWYIESLREKKDREEILAKLNVDPKEVPQRAKEEMLAFLKNLWERRKEDPTLKQLALSPVELQKNKLRLLLKNYNSIAVVTHSENIKSYTGTKPPNCSIMVYKPEYFEMDPSQVPHEFL